MRARRPTIFVAVVAAFVAVAGGCRPNGPATRPTTMATWMSGDGEAATTRPDLVTLEPRKAPARGAGRRPEGGAAGGDPSDAASAQQVLGLDVYLISVPPGVVSGNEEFWKRVDEEEPVDPAAHSLLDSNGVRVGTAALDEWPFFKDVIDRHPASTRRTTYFAVAGAKSFEMEMKRDVAAQNVFYIKPNGTLKGQSYEESVNLLVMSFQAAPREPETTRVSLAPLIRSQRKRLEVITHRAHPDDPPTREIAYTSPTYFFDLAMDARVPAGRFLVVGPSAKATGDTVGEAFLTGEEAGRRVERVLLLVPRQVPVRVNAVVPSGR